MSHDARDLRPAIRPAGARETPHGKHLARYRQIAGILIDEGLDSVIDATGLRRFAPGRKRGPQRRAPAQALAVRIRRTIERMGPTFVKIGQALSTRTDLVTPEIAHELRKLQDEVPPFSFEEVRRTVDSELGDPPERVFASFDPIPLAAASIGQVHAATLPDGRAVIVKVQRPNIRETVETDLDIVLAQARFVQDRIGRERPYDLVGIAEEFAHALRDELDYVNEARNADRFLTRFRDDDTVAFPEVIWEYTTTRVLTLERFEGIPLNRPDLVADAGLDLSEIARRGIYCYLSMIFDHGFFHADPHPGNLFALPDGRVAFTDFGRVGSISERGRDRVADLFVAIVDRDARTAADVLLDVSLTGPSAKAGPLERDLRRLIDKYYDATLEEIRVGDLIQEVLGLVRDNDLGVSSEFALFLSTLAVLEGVGAQLDPAFNFAEATRPFARRVVEDRLRPATVLRDLMRSARRLGSSAALLPEALDRLLRRAADGEFRVAARVDSAEPLLLRLEELVDRLAFAIVVASFVVGLSFILARTSLPAWFVSFARIALLGALGVGTWFFGSIILAHIRGHGGPRRWRL